MPAHIRISIAAQRLYLYEWSAEEGLDPWSEGALRGLDPVQNFHISSAKKGTGNEFGSFRTPLGRHVIRAKIGGGAAFNTVFVGRRATREIWTPGLAAANPNRDWILTRILWLCGLEPGVNRFRQVDTMKRYIYLHGSPPTVQMGEPGSIGCIRMRNQDIVDLFDRVPPGTTVDLQA